MSVRWQRLEKQREQELANAVAGLDLPLNPTSDILNEQEDKRHVLCVGKLLSPDGWTVTTLTRLEAPVAFSAIGAIVHCPLGSHRPGLRGLELIFNPTENNAVS